VACADDRRFGARRTPQVSPGGAIGLGNRGWSAAASNRATSVNELEFSARAGFASDYIYRGTTLSDHGPAAGAAIEATFGALYAGATVATVKLPTQPAAELTMAGGIRPKIASIDFDLGVTYFAYPGVKPPSPCRRTRRGDAPAARPAKASVKAAQTTAANLWLRFCPCRIIIL